MGTSSVSSSRYRRHSTPSLARRHQVGDRRLAGRPLRLSGGATASKKKPIAWYEEPGLERGAEATLVALRLRNPVDGRPGFWWSMAVGDATLFHIRGDGFTRAFPMKRSAAFSTSPHLIRSLDHESGFKRRLRKTSGEWEPEDLFFLCTDAWLHGSWNVRRNRISHGECGKILGALTASRSRSGSPTSARAAGSRMTTSPWSGFTVSDC